MNCIKDNKNKRILMEGCTHSAACVTLLLASYDRFAKSLQHHQDTIWKLLSADALSAHWL